MGLQIEKRDGRQERMLLTAMATNSAVLSAIATRWDGRLFPSRWSNIVGGWCVEHWKQFKSNPSKVIAGYYDNWSSSGRADEKVVQIVQEFLQGLSDEHNQEPNTASVDYILDIAWQYFTRNRIRVITEEVRGELDSGDLTKIIKKMSSVRKVELGSTGRDNLGSEDSIRAMFASRKEPVIRFTDALDEFFGSAFERDSFVAFMGMSKVGKSQIIREIGWRGVQQKRNVIQFTIGDMSHHQVWERVCSRICKKPFEYDERKPYFMMPVEMERGSPPSITHRRIEVDGKLTEEECIEGIRQMKEKYGENSYQLKTYASRAASVLDIESELETLERDDWIPDAIIIDYADNLASIDKKEDNRNSINTTWSALRGLSQRYHCCVVTATQCDAKGFNKRLLTRENFSDDRRKLDHVTAMYGINQFDDEKSLGLYRFNCIVGRAFGYNEKECVWVASCLDVCNPMVKAVF